MNVFNFVIIRKSALTVSGQADGYNDTIRAAQKEVEGWWMKNDPMERVFISNGKDFYEYGIAELMTI